jgi:hypothetical protein
MRPSRKAKSLGAVPMACLDIVLEFVRHPLTPTLSPNGGEGE